MVFMEFMEFMELMELMEYVSFIYIVGWQFRSWMELRVLWPTMGRAVIGWEGTRDHTHVTPMCHMGVVTWCLSANHSSPHSGPILSLESVNRIGQLTNNGEQQPNQHRDWRADPRTKPKNKNAFQPKLSPVHICHLNIDLTIVSFEKVTMN